MRFLTHSRALAVSAALLLVGVSVSSALAGTTGKFWGWAQLTGDTIAYNLQIPAPEADSGDQFLHARVIGTHSDGNTFVICEQFGEFTSLTCTANKDEYTGAWATVTYRNHNDDNGAVYSTSVLETVDLQADPNLTMKKVFSFNLTKNGSEADSALNSNDNSSNSNGNDNSSGNGNSSGGNGNDNSNGGNGNSADSNGNSSSCNQNDANENCG